MLEAIRQTDPWRCFACDGTPLLALREQRVTEQAHRAKLIEKRRASEHEAQARVRDREEQKTQRAAEKAAAETAAAQRAAAVQAAAAAGAARSSAGLPSGEWASPERLPRAAAASAEQSELVLWPSIMPRVKSRRDESGEAKPLLAVSVAQEGLIRHVLPQNGAKQSDRHRAKGTPSAKL